ncbi:hypothetical protein ACXNAL_18650 [Kluyvera ascorbata]
MSKPNAIPGWMQPTKKLTEAERQVLRNAIRGYVGRRKEQESAQ